MGPWNNSTWTVLAIVAETHFKSFRDMTSEDTSPLPEVQSNGRKKNRNSAQCDQKLISSGQDHGECTHQVWSQTNWQFVRKSLETYANEGQVNWGRNWWAKPFQGTPTILLNTPTPLLEDNRILTKPSECYHQFHHLGIVLYIHGLFLWSVIQPRKHLLSQYGCNIPSIL